MSRKKTYKKRLHNHRKTSKKSVMSGGMKPSLKTTTKTPTQLRASAAEYVPSAHMMNNLSRNLASISISNTRSPVENAVAIDCEMVGIGSRSVLAHVAIVDFNGNIIYDNYVIPREGVSAITNYRTRFSGITHNTLKDLPLKEHSFEKVKREVHNILRGKTIVGHGLENDFKVLEFSPKADNTVWDTTQIDMFKQNHPYVPGLKQPRKLKAITKEFTGNNIQMNTVRGHSPVEDAKASMNLYRIYHSYPKVPLS